jgi:hypothetical protein
LLLGRSPFLGYSTSRILWAVWIFVTPLLAPGISPALRLYELDHSIQNLGIIKIISFTWYSGSVCGAIAILALASALLIRARRKGSENEHS